MHIMIKLCQCRQFYIVTKTTWYFFLGFFQQVRDIQVYYRWSNTFLTGNYSLVIWWCICRSYKDQGAMSAVQATGLIHYKNTDSRLADYIYWAMSDVLARLIHHKIQTTDYISSMSIFLFHMSGWQKPKCYWSNVWWKKKCTHFYQILLMTEYWYKTHDFNSTYMFCKVLQDMIYFTWHSYINQPKGPLQKT